MTVTCPSPQDPPIVNRAVSVSTQLAPKTETLPFPVPPSVRSLASKLILPWPIGSEKLTKISVGPLLSRLPSNGTVLITVGAVKSPVVKFHVVESLIPPKSFLDRSSNAPLAICT